MTELTNERAASGSIGDYAQFHTLLDAFCEAGKELDSACGKDVFDASDKLTDAQNSLVEYINSWAARRATPSSDCVLPPLPEPDHSLDGGTLHFYTAEQVEQIRREAVEADRRARGENGCKWPTCDTDRVQQEIADQAYRELYSGEESSQPAQVEMVYFYRQRHTGLNWIETDRDPRALFAGTPMDLCMEYRTLYAAPPLSSEPQECPRPYYGQDFLNWNRQQPDPPVKIGRELAVAQAAFDLMTKGGAHD